MGPGHINANWIGWLFIFGGMIGPIAWLVVRTFGYAIYPPEHDPGYRQRIVSEVPDQNEVTEQNAKLANRYALGTLWSGIAFIIAMPIMFWAFYTHLGWQLGVGGWSDKASEGFTTIIVLVTVASLVSSIYCLSMYHFHKKRK